MFVDKRGYLFMNLIIKLVNVFGFLKTAASQGRMSTRITFLAASFSDLISYKFDSLHNYIKAQSTVLLPR